MRPILFTGGLIFDGMNRFAQPLNLLIADGRIAEISSSAIPPGDALIIDCAGRTLMPGLIDCHGHAVAITSDYRVNAEMPDLLVAFHAAKILRGMLDRGFTTLRDAGGATWPLVQAVETGLIEGPRLFISGRALSQSNGHGDLRGRNVLWPDLAQTIRAGSAARLVDGVDNVRKAVREELQQGAQQIKVLASGGVSSLTDPISWTQYSQAELTAIVEEAEAAETYVMAHAYTSRAIIRAVQCGVRTIEHGNLVDEATAKAMADRNVYAVPTLAVYEASALYGRAAGRSEEKLARAETVRAAGLRSLQLFREAGVKMGYGSDLSGDWHRLQGLEFTARAAIISPLELMRSATSVGAEIVRQEGQLGCIKRGALADVIVVEGDPLEDISLLARGEETIPLVIKGGKIVKNRLASA